MGELDPDTSNAQAVQPLAPEQLFTLVYDELRKLASVRLAQELPGQTLQATALVHDAYLRLFERQNLQVWNNQAHFFAAAAEAMRRILIERARQKRGPRRGGGRVRLSWKVAAELSTEADEDMLALSEAIDRLTMEFPKHAELVKLRHYCGMSLRQAAEVLDISHSTAARHWDFARSYLYDMLHDP